MQTSVRPLTQRDASCVDGSAILALSPTAAVSDRAPLFPPRDADAEARRRWLATSPWPEVVFASAGGW